MPERILRPGILTSDAVNRLSMAAEVFYRRLMSVVDDFGRFDGRNSILRASLYPLKTDTVRLDDIQNWKDECSRLNLVTLYVVDNKEYVQIERFRQRLRANASKWPAPDSRPPTSAGHCHADDGHPQGNDVTMPESESESESETETYSESETGYPPLSPPRGGHVDSAAVSEREVVEGSGRETATVPPDKPAKRRSPQSRELLAYLREKTGRGFRETDDNLKLIDARLAEVDGDVEGCKEMIDRQVKRWAGTEQAEYLRPQTLFGKQKFDGYYAARTLPVAKGNGQYRQPHRNDLIYE